MDGRRPGDAKERKHRRARALWVPGLVVVCVSACHDSPSDPLAAITTVETAPSLAISSPLPGLGELAARFPQDDGLADAAARWEDSWDRDDGALVRSRVRQEVVPILSGRLGASAARTAVQSLGWLRETPDLPDRLPPALSEPVARAVELLDGAERALEGDDPGLALELALAASDEVRSVTPEAVARRLIARGRVLMASDDRPLGDQQRARHLLSGAERALSREDYSRAIQRAYYACQVMEGGVDGDESRDGEGEGSGDTAGTATPVGRNPAA